MRIGELKQFCGKEKAKPAPGKKLSGKALKEYNI